MTKPPDDALVHIVDDDPAIRDSLAWLLRSRGVRSQVWSCGEDFLAQAMPPATNSSALGCVLLDVRMKGLTGFEVFERMKATGFALPVIMLTGHADVPMAVGAFKSGIFDFVEKPFNDNELVDRVLAALDWAREQERHAANRRSMEARLMSLSLREREVMDAMLAGRLNKQIADDLGITSRTVEVHRARVFEKMGVRNAVELASLLAGGPH